MRDNSILLKIKREFTSNEAVNAVLKINSDLLLEIGILNSELSELRHDLHQHKHGIKKTSKEWLLDDYVKKLHSEIESRKGLSKKISEWRDKYYSLLNIHNP